MCFRREMQNVTAFGKKSLIKEQRQEAVTLKRVAAGTLRAKARRIVSGRRAAASGISACCATCRGFVLSRHKQEAATKRPPEGGLSVRHEARVEDQAARSRRRRQTSNPARAITTPGNPAPTTGPATGEAV